MYAARSWPTDVLRSEAEAELLPLISNLMTPLANTAFGFWMRIIERHSNRRLASSPAPQPLYYTASYGLEQTVKSLISDGADVDAKTGSFGGTALHAACFRRPPDTVRILLGAGANPRVMDLSGMTVIDFGKRYKDVAVATVLDEYLNKMRISDPELQLVARGDF
jgi:ankyrin repeat protein